MAIYTKQSTGEFKPLRIPAIKGEKGDSGVYVGDKNSAPSSANIVIDNSDVGLIFGEQLIQNHIIDNTLTLTADKYQTVDIINNTTLILPTVSRLTEIHLFFTAIDDLTITLPMCKWQEEPNIEANKTYEFIFTYTTEWLGGCVVYG